MATIVDVDNTLDLDDFARSLALSLPPYAQPIFLRIARKIDITSIHEKNINITALLKCKNFSYFQIEKVQSSKGWI